MPTRRTIGLSKGGNLTCVASPCKLGPVPVDSLDGSDEPQCARWVVRVTVGPGIGPLQGEDTAHSDGGRN